MAGSTYTINQDVTWHGTIGDATVSMSFTTGTLDPNEDQKYVLDNYLVPQGYATNPEGQSGPGTPQDGGQGTPVDTTGWVLTSDGQGGGSYQPASALPSYKATIGDGSATSFTVTHGFNSTDVLVQVIDLTANEVVLPTVTIVDANNVSLGFSVAPTINQMRVLVGSL